MGNTCGRHEADGEGGEGAGLVKDVNLRVLVLNGYYDEFVQFSMLHKNMRNTRNRSGQSGC